MTDSAIVDVYLGAAATACATIAWNAVAEAWDEPSILPGYSVGGLAAHLGRSLITVDTYLAEPEPEAGTALADAPGYFLAVLGDHDPRASEFHAEVRGRGERIASGGHTALVVALRAVLGRLESTPLDPDRPMGVLGGTAMLLGDYLRTRLVEITVHGVDLADSVGRPPPRFAAEAWTVAARVTTALALARHPPERVALALARAERFPPAPAF